MVLQIPEREGHEEFMKQCFDLALLAEGETWPNPLVGSVIVHRNRVIATGYHKRAGEAHAEKMAIESVQERDVLRESILYVNLEPCSHYGRTPPCAEAIIEAGIPVVVTGATDTSSKVAGRGIEMLRRAGCKVITGVCEDEARNLNRRFFTFHEKGRPYVVLKWAMSRDHFIDLEREPGTPPEINWITGEEERVEVHRWRSAEAAILAGGATIRSDDPQLNVRLCGGPQPLKIVVSRSAELSGKARVFSGGREVLLITENSRASFPGTTTIVTQFDREDFIEHLLSILHEREIQSLFVEGGGTIHNLFLSSGLWDEARVFTGKMRWRKGLPAPAAPGPVARRVEYERSTLDIIYNKINCSYWSS